MYTWYTACRSGRSITSECTRGRTQARRKCRHRQIRGKSCNSGSTFCRGECNKSVFKIRAASTDQYKDILGANFRGESGTVHQSVYTACHLKQKQKKAMRIRQTLKALQRNRRDQYPQVELATLVIYFHCRCGVEELRICACQWKSC